MKQKILGRLAVISTAVFLLLQTSSANPTPNEVPSIVSVVKNVLSPDSTLSKVEVKVSTSPLLQKSFSLYKTAKDYYSQYQSYKELLGPKMTMPDNPSTRDIMLYGPTVYLKSLGPKIVKDLSIPDSENFISKWNAWVEELDNLSETAYTSGTDGKLEEELAAITNKYSESFQGVVGAILNFMHQAILELKQANSQLRIERSKAQASVSAQSAWKRVDDNNKIVNSTLQSAPNVVLSFQSEATTIERRAQTAITNTLLHTAKEVGHTLQAPNADIKPQQSSTSGKCFITEPYECRRLLSQTGSSVSIITSISKRVDIRGKTLCGAALECLKAKRLIEIGQCDKAQESWSYAMRHVKSAKALTSDFVIDPLIIENAPTRLQVPSHY